MIERKYEELKFIRTYINGDKNAEMDAFVKAQGIEDDNSDCNWIEYRRLFIEYFDDVIHVIFSWQIFLNIMSYVTLLLSMLSFFHMIFVIFLPISFISQLIKIYLVNKLKKRLDDYDTGLTTINEQIRDINGIEFGNN